MYAVFDRIFDKIVASYTVCTPYIHGFGRSLACMNSMSLRPKHSALCVW